MYVCMYICISFALIELFLPFSTFASVCDANRSSALTLLSLSHDAFIRIYFMLRSWYMLVWWSGFSPVLVLKVMKANGNEPVLSVCLLDYFG